MRIAKLCFWIVLKKQNTCCIKKKKKKNMLLLMEPYLSEKMHLIYHTELSILLWLNKELHACNLFLEQGQLDKVFNYWKSFILNQIFILVALHGQLMNILWIERDIKLSLWDILMKSPKDSISKGISRILKILMMDKFW